MLDISVVIPAFSNIGVFKNDVLTKLSGKPLIEYVINKSMLITSISNIYVATDNEELALFCTRKGIRVELINTGETISFNLGSLLYLKNILEIETLKVVLLSPYWLFLEVDTIQRALELSGKNCCIRPIAEVEGEIYFCKKNVDPANFVLCDKHSYQKIQDSFVLCDSIEKEGKNSEMRYVNVKGGIDLKLQSRHDLWIYEKLINRKKIVFNVAASKKIGMGHVSRALSLAHEITEHEVVFVCDNESSLAVMALSEHEYPVYTSEKNNLDETIISFSPSLVVNDFLDTPVEYMYKLKQAGINIINFEDLGDGALLSDKTINDLYDEPLFESNNTLWGHDYFFVRDEFYTATPNALNFNVDSILLTFGGTDQSDFTRKTYRLIREFCKINKIKIYIVTGEGFSYLTQLKKDLEFIPKKHVEFIHKTGVISSVMEKCQLAISSNGRTVYELAHMNIPTIVISHHERENNHKFSCFKHGFVNLGTYTAEKTEVHLMQELERLVDDHDYRNSLVSAMQKFSFVNNKNKVVDLINSFI